MAKKNKTRDAAMGFLATQYPERNLLFGWNLYARDFNL